MNWIFQFILFPLFNSYNKYKKLFFFLKTSLLLAVTIFSPSSLGKTDIEGSFLTRGLIIPENLKNSSNYSQLYLKTKFYPSNELKVQTHFLFSQFYGDSPFSLQRATELYPLASWLITENIQMKVGRNVYDNPFNEIISSNPYESVFYSLDGIFLEYNTSILNLNIWSAYLPKKWLGLKQEENFKYGLGFFLDIKLTENYIKSFNFHVAYLANSFNQDDKDKISRYGLALKGFIQPIHLNYSFIAVGHGSGFQFKLEEDMYHLTLDYDLSHFFNIHSFIGYHTDSSQYDPWLYDRHENAGFFDMFLWGNLTYYFAGLSLSPINNLDVAVVFYDFKSTEKGSIQLGYIGSGLQQTKESSVSVNQEKLGQELDIQIKTKVSKDFHVKLTAGLFFSQIESKNFLKNNKLYNNLQLTGLFKF